jgi:hypothetical protein
MKKFIYLLLFVGLQSCGLTAIESNNGSYSGPLLVHDNSILLTNLLLIIITIMLFVIAKRLGKPKDKPIKERLTEEEIEEVISDLKRK